ncbi:FHA domain-containing protein [Bifidobacterium sp. MA2]|uniref:FHA domain-containing protein n=1 Tax=Bifidobacterium santillanense TaxID=2809028 RepID=A0ABS5UP47_9BIFI|nr:FHA domain-containing protein [Bifidobacterium santillanense]MBT1172670.1 FHA domain-containing protein [Bifidobacterium santillanense]
MTELTFALLKYGFLILLWVFVWLAVRSLHRDISSFSPRPSRSRRRKERHAARRAKSPAAAVSANAGAPVVAPTADAMRATPAARSASSGASGGVSANRSAITPSLLVIIDGPLAGSSVPLTGDAITIGRAASNTVVLDDEFASSHHARLYPDPRSGQWAIEDLNSTNGTVVNGQRLTVPTVLPARVPVRIGATTFELR